MSDLKRLEGQQIYLIPTGNNAGRYAKKITVAFLNKVAKVNVTFTVADSAVNEKYKFNGMVLDDNCNSGYIVFPTLLDAENHIEANLLRSKIQMQILNRTSDDAFDSLSLSKLQAINNILNKDGN